MPTQQQIDSTTQKFLDIYDITNNLVILKDGTTSLIITVDAMNFGLLAEEEQDSIMYAYAGLLNSLNYPVQIIIKSQTKDVTGYLRLLKEQEDTASTNLQRKRIMQYREFVSNLIRERNVLDKKFYVAIPAKALELGLVPISSVVPGQSQTDVSTVDKSMIIEKARSILEPKRDHLIAQFARIGLYSRQLETQEIIQLFYQSYNPEAFEGQTMGDSKTYTAPLVSASIEDTTMDNQNNPNQPATPVTPINNQVTQPEATTQSIAPEAIPVTIPDHTPVPTNPVAGPTLQPTNPITQQAPVQENSIPEGYAPTQMSNNSTTTTPAPELTSQPVANTPTPIPTVDQKAPMPPAPELPKSEPGMIDENVPKEVEIKIEHPSEKGTVVPGLQSETTSTTPASVPGTEANPATPPQGDAPLQPLPEIK